MENAPTRRVQRRTLSRCAVSGAVVLDLVHPAGAAERLAREGRPITINPAGRRVRPAITRNTVEHGVNTWSGPTSRISPAHFSREIWPICNNGVGFIVPVPAGAFRFQVACVPNDTDSSGLRMYKHAICQVKRGWHK
jgi:hypothetical protein